MKNKISTTWIVVSLLVGLMQSTTGYTENGGSNPFSTIKNDKNNPFNAIDRGAASVEQSMQKGQQAIEAGAATTTDITNRTSTAITSGTAAAADIATMAETTGEQIDLVNQLSQQLGISQQQALGGAGAIFQAAQSGMEPQAFSTLSQSVPGISEMLNAAPAVSNPLGGMSSMLGKTGNTLNNAASLATSFQQLDLSPDMVGQFVPIVTNYVQNTSGQVTANLLRSALGVP